MNWVLQLASVQQRTQSRRMQKIFQKEIKKCKDASTKRCALGSEWTGVFNVTPSTLECSPEVARRVPITVPLLSANTNTSLLH